MKEEKALKIWEFLLFKQMGIEVWSIEIDSSSTHLEYSN